MDQIVTITPGKALAVGLQGIDVEYVLEQLNKQARVCNAEISHFQAILAGDGFGMELKTKAKAQIETWRHRKEQCENALLILEMICCKKDEAAVS